MNQQRKHAKLIHAWADGASIELQSAQGDWIETLKPDWDDTITYRVKVEPIVATVKDGIATMLDGTTVDLLKIQKTLRDKSQYGCIDSYDAMESLSALTGIQLSEADD